MSHKAKKFIDQDGSRCSQNHQRKFSRRKLLAGGSTLMGYLSMAKILGHHPELWRDQAMAQDFAQLAASQNKNLIWISMNGGWDILEVTDPKVRSTAGIDMTYSYDDAHSLANSGEKIGRWLPKLAARGADMVVVRGLAMGTTSHMAGKVYCDTGVLSNAGTVNAASIPAMIASESSATIPIIQLGGGTDVLTDRGITKPVSVVRAQNLELYRSMYPEDQADLAVKLKILDYIKATADRHQLSFGNTDRVTDVLSAESKIRAQLESDIASKMSLTDADTAPFLANAPSVMSRGQMDSFALTLKLVKNGLVSAVNLGIGGFDTHSNQERRLEPVITQLDHFLAVMIDQLKAANQLDNTLIVCFSDFGRTPRVNRNNGRDHWPTGGALLIGGGIAGGRVVGATDDTLSGINVNPETGLPDTSSAGVQLNPTHLAGSVLALTLGQSYLDNRTYLPSIAALTQLKG